MENIIVLETEAQEIYGDGVVQYETTETVVLDGIKMYLKSIGNHPRLTFEEEKELSVRALNGDKTAIDNVKAFCATSEEATKTYKVKEENY